jgi:Predicted transcriptional regulators
LSDIFQTEHKCTVINSLNTVQGKWKIPILQKLYYSDLRYNELKKQLPEITNIMLTHSLRDLELTGFVNRIQHANNPPHVEYSLTEYSRKLGDIFSNIQDLDEPIQLD